MFSAGAGEKTKANRCHLLSIYTGSGVLHTLSHVGRDAGVTSSLNEI